MHPCIHTPTSAGFADRLWSSFSDRARRHDHDRRLERRHASPCASIFIPTSIPILTQDSAGQCTCVPAPQILEPRFRSRVSGCAASAARRGTLRFLVRRCVDRAHGRATMGCGALSRDFARLCETSRDFAGFARLCESFACRVSLRDFANRRGLVHLHLLLSGSVIKPTRTHARTHARTGRRATRCLHATRVSAAICQLSTRTVRDPPTLGDGRRAGTRRLWNIGTARYGVVRARPPPSSPAQPCPRPP